MAISFENRKFFQPPCICAPAEGVPLELGFGVGSQKTTAMEIPDRTRSFTISSAVWIQSTDVTDRRTDRHRATAKTVLTYSVAR